MSERSSEATTDDARPSATPISQRAAWRDIGRMFGLSLRYWESLAAVVLLGTVVTANRFVRMWVIQPLIDDAVVPVQADGLDWSAVAPVLEDVGWILGASLLITPLAVLGRGYFAEWSAARVRQRVDLALARKFLHLPLSTVRDGSSGDFMARSMSDAQIACQAVTRIYKDVILNLQLVLGGVACMLWISVPLTIVAFVAVPPFWAVMTIFMGRLLSSATRRQESQGDLSDHLIAILSGIKVIKAFRGEDVEQKAFDVETGKYFRQHMKMMKNGGIVKASSEAMWSILGVGVLGVGAWAVVYGRWDLTLGTVLAFVAVQSVIMKPLKSLIQSGPRLLESAGSARRLFEILDLPEDIMDRPNARPLRGIEQGIRFRDVAFDYHHAARARAAADAAARAGEPVEPLAPPVLDGIDLEVRAGEVVAIVGRTGAGKSTLVDLLLRFHDPTRGAIEIDGVDLRDLQRASFLEHVALVSQEPFLFDESIRENIRYGRPRRADEEVECRRTRRLGARVHHERPPRGLPDARRRVRTAASPAANASGSRSRARSWRAPPCSSSTKRPALSTRARSGPCRTRSRDCAGSARSSSSPIASRRSSAPIASSSSTRAGSRRSGTTRACSNAAASTPI